MFEMPEAKRVRREDLFDDEDAAASSDDGDMDDGGPVDPELQGKLNAHLAGLLDLDLAAFTAPGGQDGPGGPPDEKDVAADAAAAAAAGPGEDDEDAPMADDAPAAGAEVAFQFRLFRGETPSHTVVIKPHDDDAAAAGPGALVHARRPLSYYLAGAPDAEAAARFRLAAVSADGLLADAQRRRCWGLETPWRVTHVTVTPTGAADDGAAAARRKRPGKKRRLILRGRVKARKEKEEAAKRQAAEKEEHLLDKKKRLNRQKKLRRRAKKREGKTADGGEPADGSSRATTPE